MGRREREKEGGKKRRYLYENGGRGDKEIVEKKSVGFVEFEGTIFVIRRTEGIYYKFCREDRSERVI